MTEFTLHSLKHNTIAFHALNMKSHVDYKTRTAEFTSNAPLERTELPLMNYAAYVDRFTWGIDRQMLALSNSKSNTSQGMDAKPLRDRVEAGEMPGATFVSTGSRQDSLKFNALKADYQYDLAEMKCDGVYVVNVADAAIAPGGDTLHIRKGGAIDHLSKSQILASRENKYHLAYDCDIQIANGKQYAAKGYIDYIDEDKKKQKIQLTDIAPNAKGMTVGNGFINDDANFTLNSAFGFAGKVRVEADTMFYHFDGGVRLLHKCNTDHEVGLLAYADYTDPENIRVSVPEIPTDWKGERITASILMHPTTMMPYPAFLTKERAADNELMHAWGQLSYDSKSKTYMIASARKQEDPEEVVDRYLKLNTESCLATGEKLRQNGHEFGATTGRPRRCGWLDLPALKYAVMLSGVTDLMMMKSDVMDDFDTVKVATAYRYNGQETKHLPFAACTETMEPVYTEIAGWQQKIDGKIPQKLEDYIKFIENYVGVTIKFVSYGPDRTQNVWR